MKKLLLYGPGGLGRQAASLLQTYFSNQFELLGFVADRLEKGADVCKGLRVIGSFDEVVATPGMRPHEAGMLVTVGFPHSDERKRAVKRAVAAGYPMPALISPLALLEKNMPAGKSAIVGAGAVVDNPSSIGDCVFISPAACVPRECETREGTILAPGAALGGRVKTGQCVFAGINCAIVNNATLGGFVAINAASLVLQDARGFANHREQRSAQRCRRTGLPETALSEQACQR